MTLLLNHRVGAESIMPPPGPAVQRRMLAIVQAMGGLIQQSSSSNPKLQGCLMLPFAGMMLAGTACARPLLFAECNLLARETSYDVVILRHDALRGTSFDIKLVSEDRWFRRYFATTLDSDVRLEPDIGIGPVFRASAIGLEAINGRNGSYPSRLPDLRNATSCLAEA